MRKLVTIIPLITFLAMPMVKAGEGMWLLPLVKEQNFESMQSLGLNIEAKDIFCPDKGSIEDAVVMFGRICTGVMISNQGLLLTNHHCGFGEIQDLSTVNNNLLENGFWAMEKSEELHAPGLTASFMVIKKDVTDSVLSVVTPGMTERERQDAIDKKIDELVAAAPQGKGYRAMVRDFFAGSKFFLIVYQEFNDVRLVGAPPNSIGKFGHDTDNWMWPRHTGDFALFRVYGDAYGNPAEYSPGNVPVQPRHYLPISLQGYQEGDLAITIGFPGRTHRFLSSRGIRERVEIFNHALITARGKRQDIWAAAMAASDKVRLQYADKFAQSSNHWKNSIGMNRAIEKLDVIGKREAFESSFLDWASQDSARQVKYGTILNVLETEYSNRAPAYTAHIYLRETLVRGSEIFTFASSASELENALKSNNQEKINTAVERLRETGKTFFSDYHPPTDKLVVKAKLPLLANNVDPMFLPAFYQTIEQRFRGNHSKFVNNLFSKSIFACRQRFSDFLDNPGLRRLSNDPGFRAGISVIEKSRELTSLVQASEEVISGATRLLIKGLREMYPDSLFYPDANFTMRLSYGQVAGYMPRDGVRYNYFTTLSGVMEKWDPGNFEFEVPEKLINLYDSASFGRYGESHNRMRVNFISGNDITGGNSGSPVINANGELIGLAFDGNWESMSGDISFVHGMQKSINVDVRYMLFIIDKFAGAGHLLKEMRLVE